MIDCFSPFMIPSMTASSWSYQLPLSFIVVVFITESRYPPATKNYWGHY